MTRHYHQKSVKRTGRTGRDGVPRYSESIRPEDPIQPWLGASGYQLLHVINDWQPARLNQKWVSGV